MLSSDRMTSGDESSFPSSSQCRHHYFGFCKTKESICPQGEHLDLTCQLGPACNEFYCKQTRRHPRYCKFYISGGFCSHGKKCKYTHVNFLNLIQELKAEVQNLKHAQRESLERIGKPKAKSQTPLQPSPTYPCTVCSKICLSTSGLKRHIQIKHAQEELLQNLVKSKPDGSTEPKEEINDEQNEESQITAELDINASQACSPSIPDSKYECSLDNPENWRKNRKKKELAFMIQEKLKSYYSRINEDDSEEEEDINPRQKYVIDLRTQKKYIYDNLEPGIFTFTSNGDLSHTIFYNQFYDEIPSSELGLQTMDAQNRLQFSNVKQVRSYEEKDQEDQGYQEGDQSLQDQDHTVCISMSQDSDEDTDHHGSDIHHHTDISTSQDSDEEAVHHDFDIQNQDSDIHQDQDSDSDDDKYSNVKILNEIEDYFNTEG